MIAWTAIIVWPFVSMLFYRLWSLPTALSATLIGGYLLLPTRTRLDLPVLPAIDKDTVPAVTALVLTLIACRSSRSYVLPGWFPRHPIAIFLLGLLLVGAIGTALSNGNPVLVGGQRLPGLSPYDIFALGLTLLMALLPFVLGRKVLAFPEGQRALATVLVISAVAYSFLALWEVRMSPQLNRLTYGFFPHDWLQHLRGGGFRPIVFLEHGLWLGIFFAVSTLTAFGMSRIENGRSRLYFTGAGVWLLGTLILSKTLGAFLITLVLIPTILFLPRRLQLMVAIGISAIVLFYPIMRNVDVIPTQSLVNFANAIEPQRAASLRFRFQNEDILLDRASLQPLFGWGGFGRNMVFDATGRNISVTDGRWVILFGQGGWVRYLAEFGLLVLGSLALFFRRHEKIDPVNVVLVVALAANLLDLLPNSTMTPLTWLLAGALVGRLELAASTSDKPAEATDLTGRRPAQYRRDFSLETDTSASARAGYSRPAARRTEPS